MSSIALCIICFCGLTRLLPDTFKGEEGETVTLDACPRCGAGFVGTCHDGKIEVEV
jgi:hypothetical protein